jgi:chaperonin GroES
MMGVKEKLIMGLRPLNDRILVLRGQEDTETKGGIIIPDTAKEKPVEGKVVAVGNGRMGEKGKRISMDVKADDRILFSKYGGADVQIDGTDYLILRQDDVFGIIE